MIRRTHTGTTLLLACALTSACGCAARVASNEQPTAPDGSPYLTGPRDRSSGSASRVTINSTPHADDMAEPPVATPHHASIGLFGLVDGAAVNGADDPAENLRQVSFAAEGADTDPAISPDGTRVFFASTAHRATPDIYVKSIDGRALTQLTNDPASDIMPSVSPDGTRLAFSSDRSGTWDLYVMNTSGGQAVQITSDSTHELHPTWSPDGRTLAFCKLGEVSGRWEIWVTDAELAGVQKFLTLGLFPDWHPTSNRILFQRSRDRGDRLFSVWTLDYVRGEATSLTEIATSPDAALINPKWSPDGEYVAFAGVPNPGSVALDSAPEAADVWIMNIRGGGLANLTGGRFTNLMPTWAPSNGVYFVSDRGGRENLWSVNPQAAMAAAMNRGGRSALSAAERPGMEQPNHQPAPMMGSTQTQSQQSTTPNHSAPNHSMALKGAASPANNPGATPAPAQTEPDSPPEMANVPIDDQDR